MSEPDHDNPKLLEPAAGEPQTDRNAPDAGTKLFVIFFMLLVPALGVVLVAAICWKLWQMIMTSA